MANFIDRFLGRPPIATVPAELPTVRDNLFSSGAYRENSEHAAQLLARQSSAMAKSFLRGVDSLKAVSGDAKPDFALDEAYPDLTQAKLANSRGGWIPVQQLEWYGAQGFIGWQMCAILSQNWLIDKACGVPAADAIRNGYDILFDDGQKLDPDVLDVMRRADKRMQVSGKCREFIKKSRIFGIRHALFIIDGINYEAPFNPDGIKPGSYRGISQIDPYWMAPVLDSAAAANPASPDFYDPTWWQINGKRIHKSHFIITRCGDDVVDLLKPSYYYGGIPLPQKLYNRVYAAERVADEAPMLAMTKRLMVLKTDTTQWFGPNAKAAANMQEWMEFQNNYSVKVVGTKDEAQQFDASLTGLDETVMTQFQLVAAAANMPATKLINTTPKGFNSTGEYEEASYHEELESIQDTSATPFIERHHLCLWRSYIAPKFNLDPKRGTEIDWRTTDSMTAKEEAEVNEIKSRTAKNYVDAGSIDGLDVRRNLISDPHSGFTGIEEIVPEGPGDREAEAEMKQAMLDQPATTEQAMDSAAAAGVMYFAGNKILLMKRRDDRVNGGVWALPAGTIEAGESPLQAACREFTEETGKRLYRASPAWSDGNFAAYVSYGEEFVPTLCEEHAAYVWVTPEEMPQPLHAGLREMIELVTGAAIGSIAEG